MKKQITKLTKQQKEKIENRLLSVFATALGAEMICLYLMNWFRGSAGFVTAARVLVYSFMILFIALAVFLKLKSNKFQKEAQVERAGKYNNWFWVAVAGFIASFVIYPTEIISWIPGIGMPIVTFINKGNFFFGSAISFRLGMIMILVGIYTVIAFIYYGIITRQAHKASLNKGKK